MAPVFVLLGAAVVLRLVWYIVRDYFVHSPLDNIPGPPSGSVIYGNILEMFKFDAWDFHRKLRELYGPIAKIHGHFGSRWLHVYDTKALHSILVKDQDSYWRGSQAVGLGRLFIGPGLLSTTGARHKKQRKMLTPVFSAAHMRNMTPMFYGICSKLCEAIRTQVKEGPKELDMLGWMGRTALELVGQGGLGYSFDPLVAESQDSFTEAVKEFVPSFVQLGFYRPFAPYIRYLGPAKFRRFMLDLWPNKNIQRIKDINDMVHGRAKAIFEMKKKAIENGDQELLHTIGEGKDVMSILLKANTMASEEDKLPDNELLAQIATFIIAGVDTTSNSLARVLYLLSTDQDAQDRLRAEILEARERCGQDIPYDELSALPYMDAICRETLRLYAPVNLSNRQAKYDTVLPLAEPIRGVDGKVITEIPVPKGTFMLLGLRSANINKALWGEDAEEWKPERWLKPLPRTVEEARVPGIYSNLMTFISGGNSCIGFKFSQLEMKVVLSVLVANFKFELSKKPIYWNFAGITFPSTDAQSKRPEMFLKVSAA